jgi:hypothetical protein
MHTPRTEEKVTTGNAEIREGIAEDLKCGCRMYGY